MGVTRAVSFLFINSVVASFDAVGRLGTSFEPTLYEVLVMKLSSLRHRQTASLHSW